MPDAADSIRVSEYQCVADDPGRCWPRIPSCSLKYYFYPARVPDDRNSGLPAYVDAQQPQSFAISTEKKQLVVTNLSDSLISNQMFRRGDADAPLMAFEVSNAGFSGARNDVTLEGVTLAFIGLRATIRC